MAGSEGGNAAGGGATGPASALLPALGRSVRIDRAIEAIAALDGSSPSAPRKLTEIERGPASGKFLSAILTALGDAGITGATRGAHGGYWLRRPIAEITVLDVFEALLPETVAGRLPTGELWTGIDAHLRAYLAGLPVAELLGGTASTASASAPGGQQAAG